MQKKKGFTLIELVVVMAIIAVLAALMVTAIVAARKAATNTQITGNAKTIETALETFSTKSSGKYPTYGTGNNITVLDAAGSVGAVEFLKSAAGYTSLSGGPAGLSTFQVAFLGNATGSSYTLTACSVGNTSLTATAMTVGTVNDLNTQGPCDSTHTVVYSTAR